MTPSKALEALGYVVNAPCRMETRTGNKHGFLCRVEQGVPDVAIVTPGISSSQLTPQSPTSLYIFSPHAQETVDVDQIISVTTVVQVEYDRCFLLTFVPDAVRLTRRNTMPFNPQAVKIDSIDQATYDEFVSPRRPIVWPTIRSDSGRSQDYAFELLCRDILLAHNENGVSKYHNFDFLPPGPDGGRDGQYELTEEPFPRNIIASKCLLQCKYSENISRQLTKTEVHDELVKALQFDPDYFILATNRNITQGVLDWYRSDLSNAFPFKRILVNREEIEHAVRAHEAIWQRYFA